MCWHRRQQERNVAQKIESKKDNKSGRHESKKRKWCEHRYVIGTKVRKKFGGEVHTGTVTERGDDKGKLTYRVDYPDGDIEVLTEKKLTEVVIKDRRSM